MGVLQPTTIRGRVVWLGVGRDRRASLQSEPVERVEARFGGLLGENHFGLTRGSCSRVTGQHPIQGTPIRNTRQVSILSAEELAETAARMGLETLAPEWVGANLVFGGIPDLTLLPPASRLVFEGGVVLTVDVENVACRLPAREIERARPGRVRGYLTAARGRRGVTAWVEREGTIALGEVARLHAPPQRAYPPLISYGT